MGATPIKTPVGESASNGGMEGGVRIFKGLLRVHLLALEKRIGARFPSTHPVLTWLVEYVGDVITKYMVGMDGKTGYERLYGRPVREEALEFGETLHYPPLAPPTIEEHERGAGCTLVQRRVVGPKVWWRDPPGLCQRGRA